VLVALGGGSVIDCAKLVRACADNPSIDLTDPTTVGQPPTRHLTLIAIPTTAGSGAEASIATLKVGEQWYLFYHDSSLSGGDTSRRCVKVQPFTHEPDGSIRTLTP
jgi:glycerol dehydrogenase-like iron-containing ADH family enzyme